MNNSEVVQDFRRRWENTYVWLESEGREDELVYIDSVEESATKIAVLNLTSDKLGKLQLNFGSEGNALQFRYPPVGVFQHERDAVVFYRRPQRQYRRGICGDNSFMWNTTRSLVGIRVRWSTGLVRNAFLHKTYGANEALTFLEKGYKGVALQSNFSITQSMFETPDYVLFHWINPVARINIKGQVTQLIEPAYKSLINQLGFES